MTKVQVEQCPRLSIYAFKQHMHPGYRGIMIWRRDDEQVESVGYVIVGAQIPTAIRLFYMCGPADGHKQVYDYTVALTSTTLPWGGVHYWFLCPELGCGRKVAHLYLALGKPVFACRTCCHLNYASQHTHDEFGRFFRKVDALRKVRARQEAQKPPPVDVHSGYLSVDELRGRAGLTKREQSRLLEAGLLRPDTADGGYRPKLVSWGRKLAYLLHKGWKIYEIKAWSAGRWSLKQPRAWPPKHAQWNSSWASLSEQ